MVLVSIISAMSGCSLLAIAIYLALAFPQPLPAATVAALGFLGVLLLYWSILTLFLREKFN